MRVRLSPGALRRPGGWNGRHAALKTRCPHGRAGSTPALDNGDASELIGQVEPARIAARHGMAPKKAVVVRDRDYAEVLGDVAALLVASRSTATRAVNSLMTSTYWLIGRRIVEGEQRGRGRAEYGEQLIERLSRDLTSRFSAHWPTRRGSGDDGSGAEAEAGSVGLHEREPRGGTLVSLRIYCVAAKWLMPLTPYY